MNFAAEPADSHFLPAVVVGLARHFALVVVAVLVVNEWLPVAWTSRDGAFDNVRWVDDDEKNREKKEVVHVESWVRKREKAVRRAEKWKIMLIVKKTCSEVKMYLELLVESNKYLLGCR
jgi:hypothetical protein